jgi:Arc/MetJ family transcription regulator
MASHLNITMDDALYERLKRELPCKRISAFIEEAVRARLRPSKAELAAASKEAWRIQESANWAALEVNGDREEWPE